jgi:phage terminase large subunit-like protein
VIHNWQTQSLAGFRVIGMRKTGPKHEYWMALARFSATQPMLLVRGQWNKHFIEQLTNLPVGHDDEADAVSQAFAHLTEGGNALARSQALS